MSEIGLIALRKSLLTSWASLSARSWLLVVTSESEGRALREITLAHELCTRSRTSIRRQLQGESARRPRFAESALFEGTATALMVDYAERYFDPSDALEAFGDVDAGETKLPQFVEDLLLFPYERGMRFVNAFAWTEAGGRSTTSSSSAAALDGAGAAPRQVCGGRRSGAGTGSQGRAVARSAVEAPGPDRERRAGRVARVRARREGARGRRRRRLGRRALRAVAAGGRGALPGAVHRSRRGGVDARVGPRGRSRPGGEGVQAGVRTRASRAPARVPGGRRHVVEPGRGNWNARRGPHIGDRLRPEPLARCPATGFLSSVRAHPRGR